MEKIKTLEKENYKLLHSKRDGKDIIELLVENDDGETENFEYEPFNGYKNLNYEDVFDEAIKLYEENKEFIDSLKK